MNKERVLVVEDNVLNQKLTRVLLEKEGYEVCVAEDGLIAMGLLETFHPNLIFMDIQLPAIDGIELTRLIRSEPGSAHIFIIALTAHRTEEWRRRALDAGCDAYLVKPVSIAALRDVLALSREDREKQPVGPAEPFKAIDREALMARLGGDAALLKDLQKTFAEECPRMNSELHRHLDAHDAIALADKADALKGMLSTLSAVSAVHAAQALELAADAGDLAAAADALARVDREVELFLKDLTEMVEAA